MNTDLQDIDKRVRYDSLVKNRKACQACSGLTNPSTIEGGVFDCDEIGAWSLWQGNLDAQVMVVGQDWGDVNWFLRVKGRPTSTSPTNTALVQLLAAAGLTINLANQTTGRGSLFFTNAVLCMKPNSERGAQSPVRPEWLRNCGKRFLRPLIEIVKPKVVVCLGEKPYRAVMTAYGITPRRFRYAVDSGQPDKLHGGPLVFPVYHCGAIVSNTHRRRAAQLEDWKRIGKFLVGETQQAEIGITNTNSTAPLQDRKGSHRKGLNSVYQRKIKKGNQMRYELTSTLKSEVYANFSTDRNSRHWGDAVQYGFLSGGGSSRNRSAIEGLQAGERVWVNVTGYGFVGVGRVAGTAQSAAKFRVRTPDGHDVPVLSLRMRGNYRREFVDNPERCEYFVPMRWLHTVPLERAIREDGFFGNQNTVCRPTTDKWKFTIERLKEKFPGFDSH
ncbi:MAG TPA: uracil-DNA glycosylase family protein [Pyrinomonadaceae bacterium]|nr:uracil-DNA glycosylase family protein [Pyrinomonadaceae bacterium]